MTLSTLSQATTTSSESETKSKKIVEVIGLDTMHSLALAQYKQGKREEKKGRIGEATAKAALGTLKAFAQKHIQSCFQGRVPPEQVNLVTEDGTDAIKLSVGSDYGKITMDRYTALPNPNKVREIVGNKWFEEHVADNSRVVMHAAMIKDKALKEQFAQELTEFLFRWEGNPNGKTEEERKGLGAPKGTIQVDERCQVKPSFAKAKFNLDVARYQALNEVLGIPFTAERFKG